MLLLRACRRPSRPGWGVQADVLVEHAEVAAARMLRMRCAQRLHRTPARERAGRVVAGRVGRKAAVRRLPGGQPVRRHALCLTRTLQC